MADNSPNSLKPTPKAKTINLKYFIGAVLLLVAIVLVHVFNIATSSKERKEAELEQNPIDETSSQQNFILADGSGLALVNEEEEEQSGIITPVAPEPLVPTEPIVIVRDNPVDVKLQEELEQIKKMRTQNYLSALNSPIISKQYGDNNSQQVQYVNSQSDFQAPQLPPIDMSMPSLDANAYDPSASEDKEDFFERGKKDDKAWVSEDMRTKGHELEIKTGTVIPSTMVTGINSELPGSIIAQVSQNVYDSATGMNLLIPQGSKLFGEYDSRVIYGQERVLVAWNRIIFPDGSAITLPAMPGADLTGNAGFHDKVNNHYFRIFGSAFLMSLITGGTSYALDMAGASGDEESLQSQMTASLAQQFGETSANLIQKNLSISPTLEIRSGYQFNIVLTKDLVFEEAYHAWR